MRDLHKILKLFAKDSVMDYCEEFDEVKSILEHCNKHVKPFTKIHFRGGNEAFINELSNRLQGLLLQRGLIDEKTKKPLEKAYGVLRKLTMFLFANTDATYKYNLRDDPVIGHVLELCPLLPKFLLVTMMWELKLDQFFYEVLSYTPCWFAFQYFETASDSMKYIDDPYDVLEKVENLVNALFISISRADLRETEVVENKIIFGKLYDYTMNFLRQFYTPDAEKFKKFNKSQFFKYTGIALKHLLDMTLRSFDIYEHPALMAPNFDIEIYEICEEQCKKPKPSKQKPLALLKEYQLKIISALQNSLQYNVMLVKIDVFMYWVEIDISDTLNLQMVIGELAYRVCERMIANRSFGHDLEQHLRAIAIRPKSLEETVSDANIGVILRCLDDNLPHHIKLLWFNELLNRNVALGNDECLQSIRDNIKLMNVEHCQKILDYIKLEMEHNKQTINVNENEIKIEELSNAVEKEDSTAENEKMDIEMLDFEDLTKIILQALEHFNADQLIQLASYEIKTFGKETTICCQSTADFQQRANEFLNKFSSSFDLQQFLILCFEHPELMWSKFFDSGCHTSEHVKNFCSTVRETLPLSSNYFLPLLNDALQHISTMQEKFFPDLLCEIYFTLYQPEKKTEFLKHFINKSVNELLDSESFLGLLPIMRSLNLIASRGETQSYKPLNFGEATAPVLLMAAQIMEKARWDLITYTDERDEIVRECIQFIQNTSKKFLPVATEKDRKWITKVMKDPYRPLTQYYFQKFSQAPNQPAVDFDRFLIRVEIEDKSTAEMFLIINYVRCTMKETEWLARSDRLLPHISDMMLILGGVVTETDNPNAVNNYRHCMINYANIVIKVLLPQVQSDVKKIEKLEIKVLKIIGSSPVEIYEEMFMSFEWLLLEIIKKCSQPLEESTIKSVRKIVLAMKTCKAKDIFLEKLQALVTENIS